MKILKHPVILLLLFSFLVHTFSDVIIVVHYELNKQYITEHFCVNRDKPELHCNGKCHLKKQLQNEEKRDQKPLNSRLKHDLQLFSRVNSKLINIHRDDFSEILTFCQYLNPQFIPGSIFRPPQA